MGAVRDKSLRVLGNVQRASKKAPERLGYVIDTGKHGKDYGWLWNDREGRAYVGIHGTFLARSGDTWYEIPTRMAWGDFVLYNMTDDRPLEAALARLPALAARLEADGGLLAETDTGPLYELNHQIIYYHDLLTHFDGFEQAFRDLGISDQVAEAVKELAYRKDTILARERLRPAVEVTDTVWLAAVHGIVSAVLVSRYRLEYRPRVDSFVTGFGHWNAKGELLDSHFQPANYDTLRLLTEDARAEVLALIAKCIERAKREWAARFKGEAPEAIFLHAASTKGYGWTPAWTPGGWVKTGATRALPDYALTSKVPEGTRALGLLHALKEPADHVALQQVPRLALETIDVVAGGRKVKALAATMHVEREAFDSLPQAVRAEAREAFAHAGLSGAVLDKVVAAL